MGTAAGDVVGWGLIAGLVVFLVGASAWRLDYDRPFPETLPLVHRDRRRWRWIHGWMLVAVPLSAAAFVGAAVLLPEPWRAVAVTATVLYGLGAVCWIASLTFRLTVTVAAAEQAVAVGETPSPVLPFAAWSGSLYVVHMATAYAAFAAFGVAVLLGEGLPSWLGWLGVGGGAALLAGFVLTRFSGPFNPPAWAHTYTAVVGVALLRT
jgi:hypothetical protein